MPALYRVKRVAGSCWALNVCLMNARTQAVTMRYVSLFLFLVLSVNLSAQSKNDDAIISIMRDILSTPQQTPPPRKERKIRQYPFNPDYPNIYLGDAETEDVSIFLELVFYGQAQESGDYLVIFSGRSSQGYFKKKISFPGLDDFQHFQTLLENQDYERLYLFRDGSNEADYMIIKKPLREAPAIN